MALLPEEYNRKFAEEYGVESGITRVGTPIKVSPAGQTPVITGFQIWIEGQKSHVTDAVRRRHIDLGAEYNNILLHAAGGVVIRYSG